MVPKPVLMNKKQVFKTSNFIAFNYILHSVADFKKSLKLVFLLLVNYFSNPRVKFVENFDSVKNI